MVWSRRDGERYEEESWSLRVGMLARERRRPSTLREVKIRVCWCCRLYLSPRLLRSSPTRRRWVAIKELDMARRALIICEDSMEKRAVRMSVSVREKRDMSRRIQ